MIASMCDSQLKDIGLLDIQRIARQHPRLLEKILAKSTGAIGEVLVADRLNKLGYKVEPARH